ncbi:unnamed protein product (macronuclear) [Paramecium tetraurelia]|uniref:Uncharacterized protein n=1 Tax=Paramecium tetraurelia TaxID=5888 RepID=A0DBY8_PARTE|nr:uncharacterized protein GSPATT00015432001 [Paramecium tetraurelia]CAK80555.1 unnamed protein product [Paramecium tetraurelia]|eukprot:XP_001447952.1 hypothetical protein (macronuclear) [Paramecium tetraurelia strain d4-2]
MNSQIDPHLVQNTVMQLNKENNELKQQLANLQKELEKQVQLSKEALEWKEKYDRLHKQNHTLDHEKKQLLDEKKKLIEEIKNLENSVQQLQEKTKDLKDYEQIKANSINVQQDNQELTRELETFKQKALFVIKPKTVIENMKQYYSLTLQWERNIQNLQLTYKLENDGLVLEGYGETGDKKIIYQQIYDLGKKILKQKDTPLISLKQSQMILTFEV